MSTVWIAERQSQCAKTHPVSFVASLLFVALAKLFKQCLPFVIFIPLIILFCSSMQRGWGTRTLSPESSQTCSTRCKVHIAKLGMMAVKSLRAPWSPRICWTQETSGAGPLCIGLCSMATSIVCGFCLPLAPILLQVFASVNVCVKIFDSVLKLAAKPEDDASCIWYRHAYSHGCRLLGSSSRDRAWFHLSWAYKKQTCIIEPWIIGSISLHECRVSVGEVVMNIFMLLVFCWQWWILGFFQFILANWHVMLVK